MRNATPENSTVGNARAGAGRFSSPARVALLGAALAVPVLLIFNFVQVALGITRPENLVTITLLDVAPVLAALGLAFWYVGRRETAQDSIAAARETALLARLDAIVDSAMDAIITVDQQQKIVLFNVAAEQVFRVPRAEALGAPLDRFIPQRFRAAHSRHIENFGKTGVTSRRMGDVTTLWALRGDGVEFPIEASISQAGGPGAHFFTVILRDITVRKEYEDALKRQQQELRELSAQVLEAREDEKTRIARELHDELGQLLTALKMDLAWVSTRVRDDPETAAKAQDMTELLDKTVAATRRISADLRPLMLDDLGLAEAAGWLVEDFGKRAGLVLRFEVSGEFETIPKAVGTTVYRALQESLTNIARHSGAKHGWVVLVVRDGEVHLEIEDDGHGIAPEDMAKSRSLGLRGMRERVAYLGGTLEVSRAPRGGTRLRLRVPLRGLLNQEARA